MLDKSATAIEFGSPVAAVDFETKHISGDVFSKIKGLRINTLPTTGSLHKEFIDPGTFTAIFEAVVKALDEVTCR